MKDHRTAFATVLTAYAGCKSVTAFVYAIAAALAAAAKFDAASAVLYCAADGHMQSAWSALDKVEQHCEDRHEHV
jgi:hypothetical protein